MRAKNIATFFHLQEHQSNVRIELLAGVTTFLSMAYILFVQPAVLSVDFAGKPTGLNPSALFLVALFFSPLVAMVGGYALITAPA